MRPYTAADIIYPRIEAFDAWLHQWFAAIEHGEIVLPASDGTPDTITVQDDGAAEPAGATEH